MQQEVCWVKHLDGVLLFFSVVYQVRICVRGNGERDNIAAAAAAHVL